MVVQVVHEERYWYPDDGGQVWLAGYTPVDEDGRYLAPRRPGAPRGLRVAGWRPRAPRRGDAAAPGGRSCAATPQRARPNAIMVLAGGELIGYVPRELRRELAPN